MDKKLKKRADMDPENKWDIEAMYPDETLWEKDLEIGLEKSRQFADLQGSLTTSSQNLLSALKLRDEIWQTVEKAFVYARMRRDEDNASEKYQAMTDKVASFISKISATMAFFTPELIGCAEETVMAYINENPSLKMYRFALTSLFRQKAHVLSHDEENLMAQMGEVLSATDDIFTMLNNADLKFEDIEDENGNMVELTHGNYITYMESHDRGLRQRAYESMYHSYRNLINTLATSYNYNTKTDVVTARIRKYTSSRAAALSGDNVPETVYDNLIEVVNQALPTLHKYIALRKKILGVDALKMHDIYVPLIKLPKRELTFEESAGIMLESLAPLGEDYLAGVTNGIAEKWIDVYENQGKTSGAYSFGSFDSKPYILLNYTSTLKDVFTLVHEMGHSMSRTGLCLYERCFRTGLQKSDEVQHPLAEHSCSPKVSADCQWWIW